VSNPIRYRLLHPFSQHADREVELIKPCASILSISAVQPDPASFSNFTGEMILKGAVSKLTAQEADIVGCEVLLEPRPKGWWWQPKPDKTLDSEPSTPHAPERTIGHLGAGYKKWRTLLLDFVVVLILEGGYNEAQKPQYCLILSERAGRKFGRVGLLVLDMSLGKLFINDPAVCQNENCRITDRSDGIRGMCKKRCRGKMQTVCLV